MVDLGTDVIPFRGAMPDAVRCMRTAFPGEAEGRNPRTPLSAAAAPHFRPNHREEEDGGGGGGEEAAERSDPVAVPSVPPLARDGPPSDRLLATEVEACDAARELRKWAARHARSPEVESTLPPPSSSCAQRAAAAFLVGGCLVLGTSHSRTGRFAPRSPYHGTTSSSSSSLLSLSLSLGPMEDESAEAMRRRKEMVFRRRERSVASDSYSQLARDGASSSPPARETQEEEQQEEILSLSLSLSLSLLSSKLRSRKGTEASRRMRLRPTRFRGEAAPGPGSAR